uniref:ABC transporter domain-containing protein n=1 Tax=Panagrolaimus superbus TaxID=310955 RepID=A0A914Z0W5_9BILA
MQLSKKNNSSEKDALLGSNKQLSKHYSSATTTTTNFLQKVIPLTLAWHGIRVSREKCKTSVILDNIDGKALPNEVVALMGASGAGKTTLLNSLMARNLKGLKVDGEIIVGGNTNIKIGDVSGYVQQDEMFMSTLTVFEHLMIQAGIRLSGIPSDKIKQRIEEIMDELGLTKCKNSVIGLSGIKKGISGGEAKRLMVASVLLDNPSIVFLDEPTTGLDSHMAQSLMDSLQKLAKNGRTIVCTIHQPSSNIFNALDKVIFLGDGKLAYFGPPKEVLPFFDSLELICPDDYNPADYIIDILAIDRQNDNDKVALERVHKISKSFTESNLTKEIYEDLKTFQGYGAEKEIDKILRRKASWFSQFRIILKRSFIDNKRNPALSRAKFIQKIIMGLFIGLLYFHQTSSITDVGVNNINGALFFIVSELTYSTLFGILNFMPADFPLVVREHFDGLYSVSAYFIARIISYMPIFILDGIFMVSISYWLSGLVPTFQNFFINITIGILIEQSAAAFGVLLSTISPSYAIAISIAGPILSLLSLTGGLYANVGELPGFIRWTKYFSWFKYGFEAMTINQWRGVETRWKNDKSMQQCIGNISHCQSSAELLEKYSFEETNFWYDIFAMIAFIFGFYIIAYIGLYIRVRRNR